MFGDSSAVEQCAVNAWVQGSNPCPRENKSQHQLAFIFEWEVPQLLAGRQGFERRSDVWRAKERAEPRGGGQTKFSEENFSRGRIIFPRVKKNAKIRS